MDNDTQRQIEELRQELEGERAAREAQEQQLVNRQARIQLIAHKDNEHLREDVGMKLYDMRADDQNLYSGVWLLGDWVGEINERQDGIAEDVDGANELLSAFVALGLRAAIKLPQVQKRNAELESKLQSTATFYNALLGELLGQDAVRVAAWRTMQRLRGLSDAEAEAENARMMAEAQAEAENERRTGSTRAREAEVSNPQGVGRE